VTTRTLRCSLKGAAGFAKTGLDLRDLVARRAARDERVCPEPFDAIELDVAALLGVEDD
jgi:hypothetical protein